MLDNEKPDDVSDKEWAAYVHCYLRWHPKKPIARTTASPFACFGPF
jgi:hypothetical protein